MDRATEILRIDTDQASRNRPEDWLVVCELLSMESVYSTSTWRFWQLERLLEHKKKKKKTIIAWISVGRSIPRRRRLKGDTLLRVATTPLMAVSGMVIPPPES
jgi:hypothetical protein